MGGGVSIGGEASRSNPGVLVLPAQLHKAPGWIQTPHPPRTLERRPFKQGKRAEDNVARQRYLAPRGYYIAHIPRI